MSTRAGVYMSPSPSARATADGTLVRNAPVSGSAPRRERRLVTARLRLLDAHFNAKAAPMELPRAGDDRGQERQQGNDCPEHIVVEHVEARMVGVCLIQANKT